MKRTWAILLALVILMTSWTAIAEPADGEEEPSLFYVEVKRIDASLSISASGTATCKGKVSAWDEANGCEVTLTLKKKSGSSWITVAGPWTGSGKGGIGASLGKNVTVVAGTYKLFVSGKIKAASGNVLETAKKNSPEKTYQG